MWVFAGRAGWTRAGFRGSGDGFVGALVPPGGPLVARGGRSAGRAGGLGGVGWVGVVAVAEALESSGAGPWSLAGLSAGPVGAGQDLVNRVFRAAAPNQLWVTDLTYETPSRCP